MCLEIRKCIARLCCPRCFDRIIVYTAWTCTWIVRLGAGSSVRHTRILLSAYSAVLAVAIGAALRPLLTLFGTPLKAPAGARNSPEATADAIWDPVEGPCWRPKQP